MEQKHKKDILCAELKKRGDLEAAQIALWASYEMFSKEYSDYEVTKLYRELWKKLKDAVQ